jgi:hypothetical protein
LLLFKTIGIIKYILFEITINFSIKDNKEVLVGSGELAKIDPFHVILKRIVLTGYPAKINRRRAVIHMMFFNPSDVKYFKPIELSTKLGLKVKY